MKMSSLFKYLRKEKAMAVRIVFEEGKAKIVGDGSGVRRFDEHELIRQIARVIGGRVVEEKELFCLNQNLNRVSDQWGR